MGKGAAMGKVLAAVLDRARFRRLVWCVCDRHRVFGATGSRLRETGSDRHSGAAEWAVVAVLAVISIAMALLARVEWRCSLPA